MNTTYLINKEQADGSIRLSVASYQEWRTVVEANRYLPTEQRRYFISDCIADMDGIDRMLIEVSAADYRTWSRDRMAARRNRNRSKKYQHFSMNTPSKEDGLLYLGDIIAADGLVEDIICGQMLMDTLRDELAAWRPWGTDLLDFYLQGKARSCTNTIAEKYGVSTRAVRKYKQQFESFIKKFFEGVPL